MRALVSTYYKDGIENLCRFLADKGVEIISTGGTYKFLKDKGIPVIEIKEITGFEEILDGRVKTLHPNIHGAILAIRDNKEHMETIKQKGIGTIDFVIVNLYPFFEKVQEDLSFEEKVEFIDIGGPSMLRAAAKNFKDVVVLCDYRDYDRVMKEIERDGNVSYNTRKYLAGKVFNLTSAYDAAISNFLLDNPYPEYLSISYKKEAELRYGENPHQTAAFYVKTEGTAAMKDFEKLGGKELSYNNIKDMDVAWKVVCEFDEVACCAVKHNTPCGVAVGKDSYEAFLKTFECDPVSIFGGIVALNSKVDKRTAEKMVEIFLEVIIAPEYDDDALEVLKGKKNLRIIKAKVKPQDKYEMVSVDGGILVQSVDNKLVDEIKVVTEKQPTEEEIEEMLFGMKVVKYVKSNAIVVVKDKRAVGIAGGQVNRIWAACQALERGKGAAVLVSDAFFPFSDVVEEAAKHNIRAIMQPGGSLRDQDSIDACNKYGISMVFTGVRHFKH
ncbi:bifunctional phosphoribosylaminoimidazolecarboxamide formyltransferase/IMP cyclohydrolase [Caloramator australicus]|uniref:Bifunctional purine biosynthesis protein PurH n=1 Tax=Caloramator australicus RC3 TaxID=857293 RepID=I7J545_9CLOT|nr:bifunctional phosphoribosylaminoimidazolecarboxamide formyltransferase/IMP cyclohydrolase [Caloramator australicus]CCJ33466.1 IMP cyclohydrolase / Phosphoribosylaminoimidazolecarboxamide formyltransferase [Caloramator australicus RC3]